MGRGQAALFERIDAEIAPQREKYEALIARPADIEAVLRDGAKRLRERYAIPTLQALRAAVGLRDLSQVTAGVPGKRRRPRCRTSSSIAKATGASTSSSSMAIVCCCRASVTTRHARLANSSVASSRKAAQHCITPESAAVHLGEDLIGHLHEGVELSEVVEALAQFAAEDA
jgi:tryptophanyl-tRNA synthetase